MSDNITFRLKVVGASVGGAIIGLFLHKKFSDYRNQQKSLFLRTKAGKKYIGKMDGGSRKKIK